MVRPDHQQRREFPLCARKTKTNTPKTPKNTKKIPKKYLQFFFRAFARKIKPPKNFRAYARKKSYTWLIADEPKTEEPPPCFWVLVLVGACQSGTVRAVYVQFTIITPLLHSTPSYAQRSSTLHEYLGRGISAPRWHLDGTSERTPSLRSSVCPTVRRTLFWAGALRVRCMIVVAPPPRSRTSPPL